MSMQLHCLRLLPSGLVTGVATGYQLPAFLPPFSGSRRCPAFFPQPLLGDLVGKLVDTFNDSVKQVID
ncbi:hypothetical protein NRY66_07545 [Acidithiobacillus ferrooxidans]|jgi:hypothetical protein|nr:hypothetical protein [Acidithiobacillus ferrooxidans]